jgi:GNAT superfamily N-acetyltransferase
VELRPITNADLAACAEVYYAAQDELYGRRGLPRLPRNPSALTSLFAHIVASDPQLCWLARDGESGTVSGFAMAVARGSLRYLSFLFVAPDFQDRGVGRALLARAVPPSGHRGVAIEAIQPASAALYASIGLLPRLPIYTFIGQLRQSLPGLPAGLTLEPLGGGREVLDGLDEQVLGFSRRQDHRAWLGWDRQCYVALDDTLADRPAVGYGYAHRSGRFGPVLSLDAAHLRPLVAELMVRVTPIDAWQVLVPAAAAEVFVDLLNAGLRIDGPPALLCADGLTIDHARYLPATFALP